MNETAKSSRLATRVALIGFGAVGRHLFDALRDDASVRIAQIITRPAAHPDIRQQVGPTVEVVGHVSELARPPDYALECAGHAALLDHVLPLLRKGVDCGVISTGGLADAAIFEALLEASRDGGGRLEVLAGAVGAIDVLAAGFYGELQSVQYEGRKPPRSWLGTPAEQRCDLTGLKQAFTFFDGSAREAARDYPKNANVTATVALAGLGFEATRVRLTADPRLDGNQHLVHAQGAFGEFHFQLQGRTLPDNPRTSMLAALSALRALRNRKAPYIV
ncbi:aspartate dehydrogenase [Frateuria aurantia]|uniref:L-aspartate dehydrogenase n=1 Tax=Frateuria aurantia (strain ATCC 33424 / DSM 6220 / KCTC 2777 / LMG 1558 / NBRC 3245 / NCIMB 13370) TaxID=767434 RepID=H8KZI2_FRAAD|nr:aspartate dehydrogenase [Frateuria aurantia]AFC86224.1 putative dinucleotide-utilizing enzyme [Frateuria aurantia DSM 6220]